MTQSINEAHEILRNYGFKPGVESDVCALTMFKTNGQGNLVQVNIIDDTYIFYVGNSHIISVKHDDIKSPSPLFHHFLTT